MVISNYQQFYNLIQSDPLSISNELLQCITSVSKICACKKQNRINKSNQCNQLYIDYITNYGDANKELWLSKTPDSEIIFNHTSHHLIKKIILR